MLTICILLMLCAVTLSACGSGSKIQGTWKVESTEGTADALGNDLINGWMLYNTYFDLTIEFAKDGKGSYTFDNRTYEFTYTINGSSMEYQDRDRSGVITFSFDKELLTLQSESGTVVLRKK